jgi:uncharacterized membrane protein
MPELTVVGYEGIHRATEVLRDLRDLEAARTIGVADAMAVYRTDEGRLLVDESVKPTSLEGATLGGLLGILIGLVLTVPITGGASAAVAASAVSTGALGLGAIGAAIGREEAGDVKATSGIPDELVKQIGGMVQPGQSALFVLADATDPEGVAQRLGHYGGTILRTTLPAEDVERLQRAMDPRGPDAGAGPEGSFVPQRHSRPSDA